MVLSGKKNPIFFDQVVYECDAFAILWTACRKFMEKSLSLKKTLEFTYSKEKKPIEEQSRQI
jgi:hypothetical protein